MVASVYFRKLFMMCILQLKLRLQIYKKQGQGSLVRNELIILKPGENVLKMITAYLGLGTNMGDRAGNLADARKLLDGNLMDIMSVSHVYVSEPWGFDSDHDFLNQVIEVRTKTDVFDLLDIVQEAENKMGRTRMLTAYSDRVIDIDILFYGDEIISSKPLIIPHPLLHKRMFVLQPMADLAPGFVHPVFNRTIAELMEECKDPPLTRFPL